MEEGALRLNHGPEEQNHDDKRMTHNMMEKRRKDRIKQWISHIAQLLPPASSQGPDKPSTLDIMERAANYIIELKASYEKLLTEQGDAVLVEEMHKMRTELDSVRAERDRLSEVLNAAGIAALNDTSQWRGNRKSNSALTENGTSPATAASDSTSEVAMANGSDESRSKNKSSVTSGSKRRNTISVHLEQQKLQQEQQQQQQQQAMAQAMASGLLSHNGGFIYSGLPGQNLMVNSNLMVSPSGQVVVSANHQTSLTAGSASSALDGGQRDNVVYGLEKSSQSAVRGGNANMLGGGSIGGLLQIAMQDAGITPSLQLDASRQSSPAPVSELNVHTDSAATDSDISRSQAQQQSLSLEDVSHDALQTLASVASNTVSSSMSLFPSLASSAMMGMMQSAAGSASLAASTVTVTSSAMNQNTPIMSVGQLGQLQQQQPSQASLVMGMPVLNHLAPNAGLGMVAPNAGQNPGAMGIMPSGTISQHGQLSMIQGAAGPGGLVPGSILMNQQGQLLMINENGLPILMQQSLDPSFSGLGDKTVIGSGGVSVSTNSGLMGGANPTISLFDHQQQALISSGALTIAKSDPGASGNLSSVPASHPQSSILAGMNPQNPGQMSFLGSQLLSQGSLQSLAVQSGGQLGSLLQPGAALNQQLMQSLGLGFPSMLTGASAGGGVTNPTNQAQHTITGGATAGAAAAGGGPAAAGGVLFPGAQGSSMVTLNTVPANPHQLPSALVLPSGHVIPVVSNPQLLTANHGGGGLMSVAPGGSGGLTSGSAGTTGHIQLQQMGGGAGTSQVIQVDPNNPGGAQVFIGPNGLQMTTTAAGQAHLTQQQQIQQLLQQQQNLNLLMPSAAISASQTIPTTTVVTLASTVVPTSAAKNVLAKAQMQTTQVLMQRNASQPRTHTTSSAIARKGSQNVKTSSSETQTSSSNASGMLMQTGCAGTGSTGSVQLTAAGGGGCATGANSSNGAAAGSAPILLMMQHNGQVVNVLVDPITLQVLNSGQTAVQTTPSVGGAVSTTVGDKSGASSSVHTSAASSGSKKSNKKNSQRTTTPKPKSSKSSSKALSTSTTSTTTSSCSQTVMSRTNATCSVTTSVTQPLVINTDGPWDSQAASNIMICDDTNNPASEEGGLAPSSDNQDILAKAAQSIFTASPTEMTSPIGGAFYNPAHDDNPLLIDTSPAGPDTDMPSSSSPKKSISTNAAPQTELSKSVDCQQQREQHSQMLQEQEALLRQQEQQEQEKLMQQEREQHEQLMRHIEQQQQQMGLTSPQTLSLIPPSMPSLAQTSDVGTLSAAVAVTTADSSAAATNTISSGTDTAGQIVPPPKKPKKSKSKKKDKEKEDGREKDGDGSKSSKKSSKKKKKEQEAAIRRQEEINQQQQLILQQQQQQQEEQTKLQHHEQEQLLLLQQHQQQQEQQSPGLMSEPQLVQPSAADMIVDEVADHVVSGASDPFVLPDSITFTESEISDVLDQVEKLGSSLVSDEQLKKYEKVEKAEKREKKSKRRKDGGQMDDGSSNPSKKQCKGNSRENDSSLEANLFVLNQQLGVRPLSQQQQDDPNSTSRMSIYDFQDDSPPGLGSAKTESPQKSKSKKSKSKTPSGTQNLLAATSPLSVSTVSTTSTMVTNTAATTTLASATTTTSAGTNTPASSLDMLVPALSQAKSDSSSVSKGSKSSKSKKSDKKDRAKSNSASSIADSLNNMNAVNSVHSISTTARVNTAASENMSIQTNGTISSSKSNDSLSSNSVDSASVILPMPGFDTLEALNSPPPLISPPVSQAKSSGSSGSKGQGQLQDQNLDGPLGQISSIVSSDIVTTMCSTSIETLADISDVVPTSNTMNMDPLMLQSSNSPPPALHHPLTLGHNSANSMMVQQQQKQKQQQQQSISNKQRQQTPPRHNPAQQMPSHSPQMAQPPQSGPTQGHAHMGPPTSPAQAVGRPRSTSLSHQQQQNQGGYLSSSPQGGAGVRQSPSASCISPSSSHSRGSHENQGFNQGAGAHMAPTQSPSSSVRLNDMSSLLNSPDISCPNANLFSSTAPKLSHMQKPTSQGKPSCTEDSAASRSRTGIYSADNFVQPSRQTSNLESCSQQSSNSSVAGNMSRMAGMNDASGESFNFTSIGLNLTSSSTQSTGQEMGVASSAGMPFSFSLTSASTTQTSSSSGSHGQVGHHSFPFYPLHPSVTQPSSTSQQSHQTQSLNMMPPGVDVRMDGQGSGHQTSGPGVGGGMPSTAQNSFNFGGLMDLNSSCSGVRDTAMPNDQSHLMSSVDKSPMASFTQHHGGGAGGGSGSNSGQKRLSEIQPPPPPSNRPPQQPTQPLDHGPPINRSPQQMGNHTSPAGNYFSSSYPSSASLNTPPLRHPPLPNSDSNHLMNRGFDHGFGSSQTSASVPLGGPNFDHHGMSYQRDMNQTRPLEHVSTGASTSSRKPSSQQQQQQQNGGGSKQQKQSQGGGGGSSGLSRVPPSHGQSRNMAPNHNSNQSQQSSAPSQAPPPAHQTSGNGQPPAPSPSQQARQAKRKQPSQSKKSKPTYSTEIDANLSHSIFDNNQSLQSFFSFQNMSPPPVRNLQSEGPSFLPGNLFGSTSRPLSNSSNKNTPDLGPPYALFPPTRPQNGLGLNFQHSFGMNTMTGNPGSGHMTPHSVAVPPHMGNFSLSNIFSDSGTNDGGINISPIKFSHPGNPILPPQAGMDPNALQHPHQGSALYHNRSHHGQPHVLPNPMTLNSILGHNHHGFDTRSMSQGINSSVGPPFHGAGHPSSFAIPPLNFSMHDH